ncbi:hypothetical protein LBMAG42_22740 [Deltaproteobacteria bacterium]|nr:hypothetical protein LBMAG42_22740 [Deltaproteobacteria bacterium]
MAFVQGIDTGAWRVRVATMEGSFRRWVLRDVVEMESSVGIAAAIEAIRADEPIWGQAERVAALPLDRGTVRVVKLPFTDRATIAKALPAEVESNVPYDLEEMVLGTHPVDQDKSGSRTRVVIARKEEVTELLALLKGVGAEPKQLVIDAEALASYSNRGVQAVVDMGHARTVIALCQGGQLIAARLIPLGGLQLTEALAAVLGVTDAEAEAAKHTLSVPVAAQPSAGWTDPEPTDAGETPRNPEAVAALTGALDEQLAEIRARLIALEDELGFGVDEVLLAGGASQLTGLAGRLAAWTGLPTRAVVVPGGHPPACALAVALARAATGDVPVTDLRIGELAYRGHADILWNVVSYGALATAAALVVGTLVVGLRATQAWDKLSGLDTKIADTVMESFPETNKDLLTDTSTALAIFQGHADETKARVEALGSIVGGEPPTLAMLKKLADVLPANNTAKIDVLELTITQEAVSFKAETDTYESAAKIEETLKNNETFAQAHKSDEKKLGDYLRFNMSIPLGTPETPDDKAAGAPAGEEG